MVELTSLSTIASKKTAPTELTMNKCKQLLDYVETHPEAILTYLASDMVIYIHRNALYLNKPKAYSRMGVHHFLSRNYYLPPNNDAVLDISQIIKAVMSLAAKSELGELFINEKYRVPLQKIL